MTKEYARVYLLDAPFCIDKTYDYYIPPELRDKISKGSFVSVPFGGGNRPKLAVVFDLTDKTDAKITKSLRDVVSSDVSLDENMLSLALFMKEQTLCTVGDAIHAMIPSSALSKLIEYFRPADNLPESKKNALSADELFVLEYITARQRVSLDSLKNKFSPKVNDIVELLLSSKLIEKELVVKDSDDARTEAVYSVSAIFLPFVYLLANGETVENVRLISKKHKAIISALVSSDGTALDETNSAD